MNGDDIQDPFESFDQLFEKYKELIPEIIKNNLISYNFPRTNSNSNAINSNHVKCMFYPSSQLYSSNQFFFLLLFRIVI